jgi:NADPH:quinone reductase-like Zn-dependent oxidoreductase
MLAGRVHAYGPPSAIQVEQISTPEPGAGDVLVRVKAAGVGPWDALIRTGHSGVPQSLPLTLGSDICGEVVAVGGGVGRFEVGDAVYGVTNPGFVGGYAQYALARASMIASKPPGLEDVEAASAPVIGVTALQMLWGHAGLQSGQSVLIHGARGNVGAYAVRIAAAKGVRVLATARPKDQAQLQALPLAGTIDLDAPAASAEVVDAALDLVGDPSRDRLFGLIRPGGVLVSAVSPPDPGLARQSGVRADFFIVAVDTQSLDELTELFRTRIIRPAIGAVLPLSEAPQAHELLADAARPPGKIVLQMP